MGRVIIIKKNVIRALLSMFNIGLINLFSFCYHNYLHSPKPSTYLKSFRFSSKSVTPSTPHLTSKSNVTKLNVNPTRSLSPVQGRTLWYRRKSDLETFSGEQLQTLPKNSRKPYNECKRNGVKGIEVLNTNLITNGVF